MSYYVVEGQTCLLKQVFIYKTFFNIILIIIHINTLCSVRIKYVYYYLFFYMMKQFSKLIVYIRNFYYRIKKRYKVNCLEIDSTLCIMYAKFHLIIKKKSK